MSWRHLSFLLPHQQIWFLQIFRHDSKYSDSVNTQTVLNELLPKSDLDWGPISILPAQAEHFSGMFIEKLAGNQGESTFYYSILIVWYCWIDCIIVFKKHWTDTHTRLNINKVTSTQVKDFVKDITIHKVLFLFEVSKVSNKLQSYSAGVASALYTCT